MIPTVTKPHATPAYNGSVDWRGHNSQERSQEALER